MENQKTEQHHGYGQAEEARDREHLISSNQISYHKASVSWVSLALWINIDLIPQIVFLD